MEQPPSTERTGPQKGDVIDGKFEIEGIIAEGRTSTVVSAIDRGNGGRKIAVKIARGSDLESIERFKRAARGMQKLTSPHAVKVLGVGTTPDGAPCMSMEYLEGRTLSQKITQSGPLPIDEATKWMRQVCDALLDAHAQKLLHRDLDAENLFLAMPPIGAGGQPSIRVLDFGLAPVWRLGKGDGRLRPGDVPGTSFAMAPELARGSDLDERVDVWGVGACLFRLLTGKHPYQARNLAELCSRILAERPPDVSKLRRDVTPGLAAVVKKCLEREPADRYRDIREVIAALEAAMDEAPFTPQVPTELSTLEEMRAIEEARSRMTPMVLRAADAAVDPEADRVTDPGPSSDPDELEGATQVHRRAPATAPKETPKVARPAAEPVGDLGAPTPQTMRIVPAFEAIANRLEPPKPKRASGPLPPPMPPPAKLDVTVEDGPSTQPLGRLSPFAELPKAAPPPSSGPSSDDHTIKPVLIGVGPQPAAPLPKPSPAMMNAETMAPPRPPMPSVGDAPTGVLPAPLPKPSPAAMAAETIPRGVEPPAAPPPSPMVFQASPRVLEMAPTPTGPPPMMVRSAPPAPVEAAPASEAAPAKSKLLVPLVFAFGIALSIVGGLYAARVSMPSDTAPPPKPSASPPVATSAPVIESAPPPPVTSAPADAPAESESATSTDAPPSGTASHRRHHTTRPPPSASAPAPVKSGSIYDPSVYDPR